MSFADQLRTAKADDEKRKQDVLVKAWEAMLDEVFDVIKVECLHNAKTGSTQLSISIKSIYEKLTGDGRLESGETWYTNGTSHSDWVKMFSNRYACKLKHNAWRVTYCFSAEDRDSVIKGIANRCEKNGLAVSSHVKEVEVFSLAPKKVKPNGILEELDFAMRHWESDENGYYTIQGKVKIGVRYEINFCISW